MIISATRASAMVPPPPPPGIAPIIRSFVQAIQAKNLTAYMGTLAEDVKVTEGGKVLASNREEWGRIVNIEFSRPNYSKDPLKVLAGNDSYDNNQYKVMVLERDSQIRCCAVFRTEVISFQNSKVSKIDFSPEFDSELQNDGRFQGDQ